MGRHLWVQADEDSEQDVPIKRRAIGARSRRSAVFDRFRSVFKAAPAKAPEPDEVSIAWRVKRGAVLCLLVGALLWIGVSLWVRPLPQTQDLGSIKRTEPEASDAPTLHASQGAVSTAASPPLGANPSLDPALGSPSSAASSPGKITVSVQGSIREPGLYTVSDGERWGNILRKAGGVLKNADLRSVNLAEVAQDGQQLYVPSVNEQPIAAPTAEASHPADTSTNSSVGSTKQVTSSVVNVNLATQQELEELPGVGPALSQRIIEFRDQNGPFSSLAELDAVSGIGPAMLKKLEGLVGF